MFNGKNLCDPGKFMYHKRTPTNKVTHKGIMEVKKGVVWTGCPDESCSEQIAIKKCKDHEVDTQETLNKSFPNFVPKVLAKVKCFDGTYMYSKFYKNGTLKQKKTDSAILKVLSHLKIIHEKFPSFRHNDLHVDNVLVTDKGDPVLYDFELSNFYGNPIFDETLKKDYGIYVGNHRMYDFHFFVNSVVHEFGKKYRDIALKVFPAEYLKDNSEVVKNWRLRCDVNHNNLPSMNDVIRIFSSALGNKRMHAKLGLLTFTDKKNKKTAVARTPPKKTTTVKLSAANKRLVSNRKAELIRRGNFENNVQAELQAIRNIEKLKRAGLLTPTPSPVKKGTMGVGGYFGPAPSSVRNTKRPDVIFTTTPRKRARIGTKLCTSYKKDDLINVMKRLGHRVDKSMTLKELCSKLKASSPPKPVTKTHVVDVRKKTYTRHLKKNLYSLAKNVGIKATLKNKKQTLIDKLYRKLDKNIHDVLKNAPRSRITARQVAEKLAKNYNWRNSKHVERLRILKIYSTKY